MLDFTKQALQLWEREAVSLLSNGGLEERRGVCRGANIFDDSCSTYGFWLLNIVIWDT